VCEQAPWEGRDGHAVVVLNDVIYLFGGTCDAYSCFNDVWKTTDGVVWEEVCNDAPWPEVRLGFDHLDAGRRRLTCLVVSPSVSGGSMRR
jgi:hypothetical protein